MIAIVSMTLPAYAEKDPRDSFVIEPKIDDRGYFSIAALDFTSSINWQEMLVTIYETNNTCVQGDRISAAGTAYRDDAFITDKTNYGIIYDNNDAYFVIGIDTTDMKRYDHNPDYVFTGCADSLFLTEYEGLPVPNIKLVQVDGDNVGVYYHSTPKIVDYTILRAIPQGEGDYPIVEEEMRADIIRWVDRHFVLVRDLASGVDYKMELLFKIGDTYTIPDIAYVTIE